jgi:hypothetical protein
VLPRRRTADQPDFEEHWAPVLDRVMHAVVLVRFIPIAGCPAAVHISPLHAWQERCRVYIAYDASSGGNEYPDDNQVLEHVMRQTIHHAKLLRWHLLCPTFCSAHLPPAGANMLYFRGCRCWNPQFQQLRQVVKRQGSVDKTQVMRHAMDSESRSGGWLLW